jgi:Protein of unknown function (DUF3747)
MNLFFKVVTLLTCSLSLSPLPAVAQGFSKQEIDNRAIVAIASPYGNRAHQLRIVEQVGRTRSCWSELGANPVEIDLLLNQFDYTRECSVGTDSNGFSMRMGDQDMGLIYSLRIVERNGDLVLIGAPPLGVKAPEVEIGRANGYTPGFAKIQLNPGWRFTRRTFNGVALGHIYLTSDQPLEPWVAPNSATANPAPSAPSAIPAISLPVPPPATANPVPDFIVPDLPLPDAGIPIAVPPPIQTIAPPPPPQ